MKDTIDYRLPYKLYSTSVHFSWYQVSRYLSYHSYSLIVVHNGPVSVSQSPLLLLFDNHNMSLLCSSPGCEKPCSNNLACPNCKKLGINNYFCDQDCFKKNYAAHKKVHAIAKNLIAARGYVLLYAASNKEIGCRKFRYRGRKFFHALMTGLGDPLLLLFYFLIVNFRFFFYFFILYFNIIHSINQQLSRRVFLCTRCTRSTQVEFARLGNELFLQRIPASYLTVSQTGDATGHSPSRLCRSFFRSVRIGATRQDKP